MKRFAVFIICFLTSVEALAGEIREFDVKTLQRLGNELTRVIQTPDRGATTAERKRARETAINALRGRLFSIRYDYVVLDDPDKSGFLVYAIGSSGKPGQFVLAGHRRVTISADGRRAERVDALSQTLMIGDPRRDTPKGTTPAAAYMNQIVSNKPVETLIYIAHLMKQPIFVGTPDGRVWKVTGRGMSIDTTKPGDTSPAAAAHKVFGR
ncbi:MAG TPA: hypothetical protein VJU77_14545 [Chthoniobacterales bacterium]|nr:hypothetical protein [Chthoniobacterales bacterium]